MKTKLAQGKTADQRNVVMEGSGEKRGVTASFMERMTLMTLIKRIKLAVPWDLDMKPNLRG